MGVRESERREEGERGRKRRGRFASLALGMDAPECRIYDKSILKTWKYIIDRNKRNFT